MKQPLLIATALAWLVLPVGTAQAKSPSDYWEDVKDYATSPLRWEPRQWTEMGGVVAGVAAAYSLDQTAHGWVAPNAAQGIRANNSRDSLPLAAMFVGTFATGLLGGDKPLVHTGLDMGEAVVLSSATVQILKPAFGRLRPYETTSHGRFGQSGSSFPSGHTTAAFAAAQVLADELPREQWGWRMLAYGLAGATAYMRMDSNAHWLSDTVAGAALGIATGRFVSNRSDHADSRLSFGVTPLHHGAMLTFALTGSNPTQ
ncbi:MAG: phosphatase PAP2 family protein [Steroidobacteraceae bacterium]